MTFMEITDRLNRLFPPTTDFDYRDIEPDALWRRVYDFIEKIGLLSKYTDKDLIEIRDIITFEQKNNYHKKAVIKNNVVSNAEYSYEKNGVDVSQNIYGFDQNNYVIKHSVLRMKEYVFTSILEKSRLRFDLITDEFDMYNRNMGSLHDIEEHIDEEEIETYLVKLLTVSKEDNDFYRFEVNLFVRNVLLNFGFNPDSEELYGFSNRVNKLIDSVLFSSPIYKTEKSGKEYADEVRLNRKRIKELAELIASTMRTCLKNRQDEEFKTNRGEIKEAEKTKKTASDGSQIQERIVSVKDLDEQHEGQQKLLDRNKRLITRLKEIEQERKDIQNEIEENNAKMASMKY